MYNWLSILDKTVALRKANNLLIKFWADISKEWPILVKYPFKSLSQSSRNIQSKVNLKSAEISNQKITSNQQIYHIKLAEIAKVIVLHKLYWLSCTACQYGMYNWLSILDKTVALRKANNLLIKFWADISKEWPILVKYPFKSLSQSSRNIQSKVNLKSAEISNQKITSNQQIYHIKLAEIADQKPNSSQQKYPIKSWPQVSRNIQSKVHLKSAEISNQKSTSNQQKYPIKRLPQISRNIQSKVIKSAEKANQKSTSNQQKYPIKSPPGISRNIKSEVNLKSAEISNQKLTSNLQKNPINCRPQICRNIQPKVNFKSAEISNQKSSSNQQKQLIICFHLIWSSFICYLVSTD